MESERAMLAHRASHDTLTAMPNRAAFDEQLARRIEAATQRGAGLALLFIDADQFKTANDNFGHAAGDAVLVAMSERIKATLRKQEFEARVGGDEVVVIVDPVEARRQDAALEIGRLRVGEECAHTWSCRGAPVNKKK